jgi:hypothetical protein
MADIPPPDKELDFSNFFSDNNQPTISAQSASVNKPQNKHKRTLILVGLAVVLLFVEVGLLVFVYQTTDSTKTNPGPAGYHLVTPNNGPAYFQRDK